VEPTEPTESSKLAEAASAEPIDSAASSGLTIPKELSETHPSVTEKEEDMKKKEEAKEGEEVKVKGEKEKNVKRLVIDDLPGDTVEELLRY
jgi:hypothetical protein